MDKKNTQELLHRVKMLQGELDDLKKETKEIISTTWRFIGAYRKENAVPISMALRSCEYHLRQLDHLFEEKDDGQK